MKNIIELKNISKTYNLGTIDVPVLHDITLSIEQGEFVTIMGHSGSGKSTLLNILGLLDKPTGGSFTLAGKEVSRLSDDELAALRNKFMGFIFQQFNLLPRMSARENVVLPTIYSGGTGHSNEIELLKRVGLADRILHKPNELSGGQQQRVAIARSLINNPPLLLADEPTGNLDTRSTAEIINLLKELNAAGITILMVTHEPDFAAVASRVIKIQDGRAVEDTKNRPPVAAVRDVSAIHETKHSIAGISRVKEYFMQAIRALLSNKTRSALSILGVLIGVSSLIAMLALGRGAQEDIKKRISNLGSNLLSVRASSPHRGGISMGASGSVTRFTMQDAEAVKERISHITHVVPMVTGRGQAVYNGKNTNTSIEGTGAEYALTHSAIPSSGRFYTEKEVESRARVAVIGKTVAKNLFGSENPIGKFIKIQRIDFQVIGVLPEKGASGFHDEDDKIDIPINTAMYRLMGKEFVDYIEVQVSNEDFMDDVSDRVRALLVALHRLPASKSDTIDIRNLADIQETISATANTFSYLLGGIAFISLLVGGIGIMNIMLVSVTERTREIGLRKAIGANTKDILFQFVIESIVVCVLGGTIGILLGSAISLGMAAFAGWSTSISLSSVGLAFTFSVLIGLVFGLWPARKASQLNPIEALRHE
jgi:macrolide transport system ATP-binding/permease protein